ncbi:hypothetical protein V865_003774 [Kwoniella europaea PYCC6329]|uniref:DUF7918 domain-containing protein n=1 Tax=Kwoniella europaea PYCC6329 TaxID=1423913 RepID=A0AAX4KK51_9TREE
MLGESTGAAFEAWVGDKETGERLNEYQIEHHPAEDGQPAWSECFLETIDEPFQIKVVKTDLDSASGRGSRSSHRQAKQGISCVCTIDGESLSYSIWFDDSKSHGWTSVYEKDEMDGKVYKASLNFAPLPTTDEVDKITIDDNKLKQLGVIEITIHKGYYMPAGPAGIKCSNIKVGTADEKAKKFSYTVGTSNREEVRETDKVRTSYTFYPYHPLVKDYRFVFKYRPRAMLVHSGIINEPPPLPQRLSGPPRNNSKRKRNSEHSEVTLISDDENEGRDVKPDLERKRVKYLEDQVKKLSSELNNLKKGGKSKVDAVDLTLDDD